MAELKRRRLAVLARLRPHAWLIGVATITGLASLQATGTVAPIADIFNPPAPGEEPPTVAQGPAYSPQQPVAKRRRPDYDPPGLHLGGFLLFPSLSIDEKYDDNIRAANSPRLDDVVTTIIPSLLVESTWSRHALGLEAFGEFRQFAEHTIENTDQAGMSLTGRVDVTSADFLSGFLSYSREAQDRSEPDDTGQRHPSLFDRYILQTRYDHRFTRFGLRLDAQVQRFDYVRSFDDDRDRTEFSFGPRLTYQLSPSLMPFIEASYLDRDYDSAVDRNGMGRDARTYDVMTGIALNLDSIVLGEVAVGAFHTNFDDPALDPVTSAAVSGSITWNITGLTSVTGKIARREAVTTLADTSSKIVTLASLRVDHELRRNILLGAEVGYRNEDFKGTSRVDNRVDVQVGGTYLINRNVSVSLSYQHTERQSNFDPAEFSDNIVRIGVDLRM
jgi:hypothetical protein